jgi:hypothetical protein
MALVAHVTRTRSVLTGCLSTARRTSSFPPSVLHPGSPTGEAKGMGLGVSLLLIAVGAVLGFAVHPSGSQPVDVNVVGYVLLVVGFVGALLSLLWWESWAGAGYWGARRAVVHEGPAAAVPPRRFRRRRTTTPVDEGPGY